MKLFLLMVSLISSINSAVCNFSERVELGGKSYKEEGVFYFERGVGMRWEYLRPERKIFWMKKGKIFEFYPEDNIFREYESDENFWNIMEDPYNWKSMTDSIEESDGKIIVILKNGDRVRVEVKRGTIREVIFGETSIKFSKCRYNTKIPSPLFKISGTLSSSNRKK